MSEIIQERRDRSKVTIEKLRAKLADAEQDLSNKACVYVTGSFGRREAGPHSDLDAFIVAVMQETSDEKVTPKPALKTLDGILVQASLIKATKALNLPDFDGDGRFLTPHSVQDLVQTLGKPDDDANNTFTARLLLLLESCPLIGEETYNQIIGIVIDKYWRDFEGHETNFRPAFLVNDILRLWRTFCINYEAKTENTPEEKKITRRVKNFKLKFSRLLTCYSAIADLLEVYGNRSTVTQVDAVAMVKRSPIERIEEIIRNSSGQKASDFEQIKDSYSDFLDRTKGGDEDLRAKLADNRYKEKVMRRANDFADQVSKALKHYEKKNDFYRIILV